MLARISTLKDRQYKALTGLDKLHFDKLSDTFKHCEQQLQEAHYREYQAFYDRKPSKAGKPLFEQASEKLFFLLFYLKTYPTFDVLGFTFGCSGKTAHTNLYKYLPVLQKALANLGVLPARRFEQPDEFIDFVRNEQELLIDATERAHHRKKTSKGNENITMANKRPIPLRTQ